MASSTPAYIVRGGAGVDALPVLAAASFLGVHAAHEAAGACTPCCRLLRDRLDGRVRASSS
jgi:hypothetical protein